MCGRISERIADLGAVPPDRREGRESPWPLRELRELLRYRRHKLVESQAAERNRLLKLLETANISCATSPATSSACPAARCSGR